MGPFDDLTAAQRQQIREAHAASKVALAASRGTCPVCGREMQLKKDGRLRHHGGEQGGWPYGREYRCKGAGQRPAGR